MIQVLAKIAMHQLQEPVVSSIVPGLFVANTPGRNNENLLVKAGIKRALLLGVNKHLSASALAKLKITFVEVCVPHGGSPITRGIFWALTPWIEQEIRDGSPVLIASPDAIVRAPAAAIAYLVSKGTPFAEARETVATGHPLTAPDLVTMSFFLHGTGQTVPEDYPEWIAQRRQTVFSTNAPAR